MGTTSNCELCLKLKLPTYDKHASKTIDLKKEKKCKYQKATQDRNHILSFYTCLETYQFICGQFPCKSLVKIALVCQLSPGPSGGRFSLIPANDQSSHCI